LRFLVFKKNFRNLKVGLSEISRFKKKLKETKVLKTHFDRPGVNATVRIKCKKN